MPRKKPARIAPESAKDAQDLPATTAAPEATEPKAKRSRKRGKQTEAEQVAEQASIDAEKREAEKQVASDRTGRTMELAKETMKGDLRTIMLELFKHRQKSWQEMSESEQGECVSMIEDALDKTLDEAVQIIAADERVTCVATLDSVAIKDGIKLSLSVAKRDKARHDICDATGLEVLLIVASGKTFGGEKEPAKIDSDQPGLPLDAIQKQWEADDAAQVADGEKTVDAIDVADSDDADPIED